MDEVVLREGVQNHVTVSRSRVQEAAVDQCRKFRQGQIQRFCREPDMRRQ
jgi:hypothetical protein